MTNIAYRWTHPSVHPLSKAGDPIQIITDSARRLVFKAVEAGWIGPPFDPFKLADFLSIRVVARNDIPDARTVPAGGGRFQIEFNPNRPRHRIKYSICHEIAHTLFADCGSRVQNRLTHQDMRGDDWQLEMLCNAAAAELLMPIGSFSPVSSRSLSIDHILETRATHEVSTEAVVMRAIHLATSSCSAFSASSRQERGGHYLIEYSIPSRAWKLPRVGSGFQLPKSSLVSTCTAIGHTAKGTENWSGWGELYVECVGLPPYPNETIPRTVGLVRTAGDNSPDAIGITYLKGDATTPHGPGGTRIIAQIVNDAALTWGAGFSLAVRKKWPAAQHAFRRWAMTRNALKLGNVHVADVSPELTLVSLVAQRGYGPSPGPRIRYAALDQCLQNLCKIAKQLGATVHVPRIGAGQAGGAWPIIEEMIESNICAHDVPVFVYDLPDARAKKNEQFSIFESRRE